jgi:subtilisin family serine protease
MRFFCLVLIWLVVLSSISAAETVQKRALVKPGAPAVGLKKQSVKPAGPRIKAVDPVVKPPGPKRVNPGIKPTGPTLVTPPKVRTCSKGTTGKWPDCKPASTASCADKGLVGKWPNCSKPDPKRCPKGTSGKWPNCIDIAKPDGKPCPKGTTGKWPNCIDVAKPDGGGGKSCPEGQVRKGKSCVEVATGDPGKSSSDKVDSGKGSSDKTDSRKGDPGKDGTPPKATIKKQDAIPPTIAALVAGRPHRPREILVLVDAARADEIAARLAREHNVTAEPQVSVALLDGVIVQLRLRRGQALESLLAAIDADPDVELAQPNYEYRASKGPMPGGDAPTYAGKKIRLEEAHRLARGVGVVIAVIDTAIDADHPELAGAIAATFDAVGGAASPDPHGTQIAGILAARDKLKGVAPDAKLLGVRAFSGGRKASPAQSTTLQVLKGIDWAFASRARVMNMSFAGPMDPLLERAIKAAAEKGAIFIAAAGNNGPKAAPAYPAAYADVIAVTAVDEDDKLYVKANRGDYILVAAPGVDIAVPVLKRKYDIASGTSMAAAHVSGVVALLLERNAALSAAEIRTILSSSARKPDEQLPKKEVGVGVLDAAGALAQDGEIKAGGDQPSGTMISAEP